MPASNDMAVGPGVTLHRVATAISAPTETNIEAAAIASNLIGNVESITPPVVTRETYDRMELGEDNTVPIPGRISLGEMNFSVYFDASNTVHTALRDEDKRTIRSFIYTLQDPASADNRTYCVVNGFVTNADIEELADNQVMLNVVVKVTATPVWVDNT